MRFVLLVFGALTLAGCADIGQDIYDAIASDSCTPGNTPGEERTCQDRVDRNSDEHRRD